VSIISDSINWLAEVLIGQQNFGKVKLGQVCILKFDSYNFEEFGIVKGKIKSIAATPQEIKSTEGSQNMYLVQIALNDTLTTSYHQTIQTQFGFTGAASIVLDDKNLLEKLFLDKFKALFVYQ
jgi:hypothetical protein